MKLADLPLDDLTLDPHFADVEIAGLAADSRKVKPGFLFVAIAGAKVIERVAPLLDLKPRFELPKADQLILAKATSSTSP